jgi:S-disulfanyl-L-cysteine oxidoreductase SoxD
MNFKTMLVAVAAVWTVAIFHSSAGAQAPKSVWDGAYTEEQSQRGAAEYTKECSECHSPELMGDGFAPALAGTEFLNAWNGLAVADLFERIRISMPPGKEHAVTPQAKADIVAYILQANKFPAGETELAATTEALKGIKFEATKPGQN